MTFYLLFACGLFAAKRQLRYLRYFQQEEYTPSRFLHWLWENKAFDKRGTTLALLGMFAPIISLIGLVLFALIEPDPRKVGKKKLVLTQRASRIFGIAFVLYLMVQIGILFLPYFWILQALLFQAIPLTLVAAVTLLQPDEARRQAAYRKEAEKLLAEVNPFVIGITGSYGKTSTKNALGKILEVTLGSTFWPEKGVNTPMGITREIRTKLKPNTQFAVMEMGAYGPGSIQRLCELTPPKAAIITCIGLAHLERFGSQEIIRKTKSELAQAVPGDGILVCNGDNPGARQIAEEFPKRETYLYGFDSSCDCWVSEYRFTTKGTEFTLEWKGKSYSGFTALHGKTALSNVIGAFTMACALGAQPDFVIGMIHHLKPVDNRLQCEIQDEITYIHDAYNSNPTGFDAALEVLKSFPAQRRILMTPGMIELADQQEVLHEQIGRKAAQICDMAIVVGELNQKSLKEGLQSGGLSNPQIKTCVTREEAFSVLKQELKSGDVVLIENDLPDLFEMQESF